MTDKNLENIRKNYKSYIDYKNEMLELFNKKQILENTPEVKEYLRVINQIDLFHASLDKVNSMPDVYWLNKAIDKEKIQNTNNIYVCIGTYKDSSEIDREHGYGVYRVAYDDPTAQYRIYQNIEQDRSDAYQEVSINECEEFEKNNFVLYSEEFHAETFYNQIRQLFFETALESGQDKAIEKVKSYKKG